MTHRTELRTARLLLRPFDDGDVDALEFRDDPEFARFLPHVPQPFTRRDAEAMVAQNLAESWEHWPTFVLVLEGKLIGTANLEVIPAERTAMLGYAIGREWWGLGFAIEAARAIIAWGIETYGLTRIWASTDLRNVRSQRVMEKLGMRRETVRTGYGLGRSGESIQEVVYGLDVSP